MRLDYIDALMALTEVDKANRETKALKDLELPAALRGRVKLLEGGFLLGEDDRRAKFLILAALDESLTPADRSYAQGLLEDDTARALARFQQAIEHNPRHLLARSMASLLLFTLGRLEELIIVAEQTRVLYPEHPNSLLFLVLAHSVRGSRDDSARLLAQAKPNLPRETAEALEELLRFLPLLRPYFYAGLYGDPVKDEDEREVQQFMRNNGVRKTAGRISRLNFLPAAEGGRLLQGWVPPGTLKGFVQLWDLTIAQHAGEDLLGEIAANEEKRREFGRTVEAHPEGFLAYLQAQALMNRCWSTRRSTAPRGRRANGIASCWPRLVLSSLRRPRSRG